ncbi:hypothetical protein BI049_gp117 [Salmonella phage vB_SnwM_CGG4-1]|uniref:Uncharacterized protein n=1 Tax=Salmonella phage vB_SnwM_CGG4-1 TaxID=1815631 RepID=A0A1B0VVF1_9CAUD|nr:hypothetical protein BI049_gp117 [Salmonella phage vB_SnwM_CGG4-1]ANA49471.1 hypothetical protein CGG41_116 [Salmonella phage vB_SnwM_CGG4-1]
MNKLEELVNYLEVEKIEHLVINDPKAVVLTNTGHITLPLTSVVVHDTGELVDLCRKYTKTWIYSVEPLAASGMLMMRYSWVI